MGMFDSFYDADGRKWQTKAFGRNLDSWRVGDAFDSEVQTFQVEVLGADHLHPGDFRYSYVTIRDSRVEAIDVPRDPRLPLLDYGGHPTAIGTSA